MQKFTKRSSLSDLIEKLDWHKINYFRTGKNHLPIDKILVEFAPSKKNDPLINRIIVRIGHEVLKDLYWEPGDVITPLYNPDDELTFLLCKSDNGSGYTLSREQKKTSCKMVFKWEGGEIKLDRMLPRLVEFEAHRKKLIFSANRVMED